MKLAETLADLNEIKKKYNDELAKYEHQILVCGGAGCVSSGCAEILEALRQALIENKLAGVPRIRLVDLFPFIHRTPWSHALEGRRVLVVHPFADSIQKQYARRALLFKDPRVLPEFELTTLKAVQSIAGNKTGHSDWFAALDEMKEQMTNIPHDIALIGCGAYGFPLAAHAKRLGKKAVHMGGATQLLFGIRGKRWDQDYAGITDVINTHWTRPAPHEVPTRSKQIEGGCYW